MICTPDWCIFFEISEMNECSMIILVRGQGSAEERTFAGAGIENKGSDIAALIARRK